MSGSVEINNAGNEDFLNAAGGTGRASSGGPATLAGRSRVSSSQQRVLAIQAQQRAIMARDPKSRALRQRMDNRSTDKYYRATEVSAIGDQLVSDSTLKPGEAVKPPKFRTALAQLDERNTDRYYRDALVRAPTKQQLEQAAMRREPPKSGTRRVRTSEIIPQGSVVSPVRHRQAVHPLSVSTREEVREAAMTAVQLLRQGHPRVVIKITGIASLAMQVNTILDGMVGRDEITEDQRRDIKVDLSAVGTADRIPETRTVDEMLGSVGQLKPELAQEETPLDPEAFLTMPDTEEEESDIPEVPVTKGEYEYEDDESDDTIAPAAGTPPAEEDFLNKDEMTSPNLFGVDTEDDAEDDSDPQVPTQVPTQVPKPAKPKTSKKKKR